MKRSLSAKLCVSILLLGPWLCLLADPVVDVRDYGAKGDAKTDDTEAIRRAFSASSRVHFPAGVYLVTDGLILPKNARLTGDGSPNLGVFPRGGDAKEFFAPGRRAELPGTTLLFRGKGKQVLETGRSDSFASLRYALKTTSVFPYSIEKLAIALDLDVYDAKGKLTKVASDNRSDFDVGLLVDDSSAGTIRDVAVFGFWKKAGLCLLSRGLGDNPDYNTAWNSSFMGEHGVALIGLDKDSPGLSGTQFYGCRIFANDHHSRGEGQWGSAALYIDGDTPGKRADLNGHYFFGGCIRTYNNVAVRLDHASNVSFHGVIFEVPGFEGKKNQGADTTGKVVGTGNTRDVGFFGCRMHNIGLTELGKQMQDGSLAVFPDQFQSVAAHYAGKVVRLSPGHPAGASIQLTGDGTSANNGWTIRNGEADQLLFRHQNRLQATLTPEGDFSTTSSNAKRLQAKDLSLGKPLLARIEDGATEVRSSRLVLFSSVGTALTQLNGGTEGQILILTASPKSASIEVLGHLGNLRLGKRFMLTPGHRQIMLMRSGDIWVELSRSAIAD